MAVLKDGALTGEDLDKYQATQAGMWAKNGTAGTVVQQTPKFPTPFSYGSAAPAPTGGAPSWPTAGGTVTNFAKSDPHLESMVAAYKARLAKLQDRPALDPTWTQRAISSARGGIMDTAAGVQEGATARLAAQGRLGGGSETGARSRIAEAATRSSNKAASDISLARTRDEENNALQRDAMENNFTLGGQGIMGAPGQLALQQQGLGLQQMLGMGNLALGQGNLALDQSRFAAGRDDQKLATLMAMLRSGGYEGFSPAGMSPAGPTTSPGRARF